MGHNPWRLTTYKKAQTLIENLANYGLFIIPIGELESWVPGLTKGAEWDNIWLEKLETPTEQDFDNNNWWGFNKWAFINKIATWINDPNRKGLN